MRRAGSLRETDAHGSMPSGIRLPLARVARAAIAVARAQLEAAVGRRQDALGPNAIVRAVMAVARALLDGAIPAREPGDEARRDSGPAHRALRITGARIADRERCSPTGRSAGLIARTRGAGSARAGHGHRGEKAQEYDLEPASHRVCISRTVFFGRRPLQSWSSNGGWVRSQIVARRSRGGMSSAVRSLPEGGLIRVISDGAEWLHPSGRRTRWYIECSVRNE